MKQEEAIALLDKYLAGECTPQECRLLNLAYNLEIPKIGTEPTPEDYEASRSLILSRLQQQNSTIRPVKVSVWPRIAAVAAVVALIVLGVYFFSAPRHPDVGQDPALAVVNDIAPGKNTATLTLANGKTINLSDEKSGVVISEQDLTYSDNTHVISNEERQLLNSTDKRSLAAPDMTVTTPRGGMYQVVLPDRSKVWLNADSRISFPKQFAGNIRKVLLKGEAYFEVTKDKTRPFVVESRGQSLTVLGTHFNVNSYDDEGSTKTTLLEGSVRISRHPDDRSDLLNSTDKRSPGALEMTAGRRDDGKGGMDNRIVGDDVVLKPGQQSLVTANQGITVKEVDPAFATAWKNNEFMFESETLPNIMKMVERWYDVKVIYEGALPGDRFNGGVSRFDNVSKVLQILESTKKVHFRIEGRTIYVQQ